MHVPNTLNILHRTFSSVPVIFPVYIYMHVGFLKWGYPKIDGLQGKILLTWMMTGGAPILGNPHAHTHHTEVILTISLFPIHGGTPSHHPFSKDFTL